MSRLRPGEAIAGRYQILRSVRSGGISVVYQALDDETGAPVALKVINIPDAEDALIKRIKREIRILSQLQHPHIVRCLGSGALADGRMFIVLDWLEGEDLADFKVKAPVTLRGVLDVIHQVGSAIDVAHGRGIIHRDIKPANLYLVRPELGKRIDCRVLDFGVAKVVQGNSMLTRAGAILGTPSYMAPEQANFAMSVDGRADVFSLGVVAFEILTGRLPWSSPTDLARLARILVEEPLAVRDVNPDVPTSVAELIDGMIELDVEGRIGTAYEVCWRAERCLDELSDGVLDTSFTKDEHILGKLVRAETIDVTPPKPRAEPARKVRSEEAPAAKAPRDAVETEAFDIDGRPPVPLSDLSDGDADQATQALDQSLLPSQRGSAPRAPSFDEQLSYVDHTDKTPMFGRVQELDRARKRALEPIRAGGARAMIIVGPAGIGKTRMRSELAKLVRMAHDPPRVFSGRAEDSHRSSPFAFLRRVIFTEARILSADSPEEKARKVQSLLPAGRAFTALADRASPLFGFRPGDQEASAASTAFLSGGPLEPDSEERRAALVGFALEALRIPQKEIPPVTRARFDPRLFGEEMRRSLDVVIRAVCQGRGFVLIVDDAHLLDHQSALVLSRILEKPDDLQLSLIALGLPNLLDTDTRTPSPLIGVSATRLELSQLEPRPSRELARSIVRGPIGSKALEDLVNRAAGNPLYLEQVVRAVTETCVLAMSPSGELELTETPADEPDVERIPPTVAAAVSARLAALPPRTQKVLTAAAVFGEVFWIEGVASIVGEDVEDVTVDLDRAILTNLVRRRSTSRYVGESEMEFSHAVIRSVALSKLKRRFRHAHEKAVAAYLTGLGEMDCAVIAAHVSQSGEPEEAATLYADAAEASLDMGDPASAATLADEGLLLSVGLSSTITRRRLIELVERIAILNRDFDAGNEALDALEQIIDGERRRSSGADDLQAAANRGGAKSASPVRDPMDAAEETLDGERRSKEERAGLLERRSRLALLAKDHESARYFAEEARARWSEASSAEGIASAELRFAEASEALGDGRSALRSYLAAQARFTESNVIGGLIKTTRGLATIALSSGDYRTAENRFKESLKHAHTVRDHDAVFRAHVSLAEVATRSGDPARARDHIVEAERVAFEPQDQMLIQIHRARLLAEEGNPGSSYERLVAAIEMCEARSDLSAPYRRAVLAVAQIIRDRRIARLVTDGPLFMDRLEQAIASARREEPGLSLPLTAGLALACSMFGQLPRAEVLIAEVTKQFDAEGAVSDDEPPGLFLGAARVREAKPDLAKDALRKAVTHLDSVSSRLDRQNRQRYLSRPIARTILEEAARAGLEVVRDASSNRIVAR
jgi:serine/threonine protein kinase/tetratricopeptide (TPR) repeat protein